MNLRNLAVVTAAAGVVFAAGLAFWNRETMAAPPPGYDDDQQAEVAEPVASGDTASPVASDGVFRRGDGPAGAVDADAARKLEAAGLTSGVVRGDISLAVSVLDRLGAITIAIEEMRSPHDGDPRPPFSVRETVERGRGTPTFEVRDIPFSDYPYRVRVIAPGLNGGRRTLSITDEDPLHDVTLTITPGAPFSVLLRDQDGNPHPGIEVLLRPLGEPGGRPRLLETSDNFGRVMFPDVLAGSYELVTTSGGQPFAPPEQVSVSESLRSFGGKVQGQGHVMTIPRGVQVDVQVHDSAGYGLGACKVTAIKTDQRRLCEYVGETDDLGRLRFPHLQPGRWQLTFVRQGYQRVDQMLNIEPDQQPIVKPVRLVRPR